MTTAERFHRKAARAFLYCLAFACIATATIGVLWQQGSLKRWLQARAVAYYLDKIQPHLPFEIEELQADAPLGELLRGHLKGLTTVLRWQELRLRLSGPIELTRPTSQNASYSLKFDAIATLEPVGNPEDRSSPFSLDLYAKASEGFDRLLELEVYARAKTWTWRQGALSFDEPDLAAAWKSGRAELGVSFKQLKWKKDRAHELMLTNASASTEAPLTLKPFVLGPQIHVNAKTDHLNGRWEDLHLNLGLATLPLVGGLTLVPENTPDLSLQAGPIHAEVHAGELKWRTTQLPIRELLAGVLKGTQGTVAMPSWLGQADVRAGTVQTEGRLALASLAAGALPTAQGVMRIQGGAFQLRKAALAARGIQLDLPFSTAHGAEGVISAQDLFYRKAHASLAPTDVALENLGRNLLSPEGLKIRVGASQRGGGLLPISIDEVPAAIGAFTGTVHVAGEPWSLESSLKLPPVALEKIVHPLCIKNHSHWAPARVEAALSKVALGPGSVDPDGEITAHLFDGTIRANDIGLFDLGTSASEVDFTLDFTGIQLDQLCDWAGFGQIVGTLQGHARDVTFQGWLPTHFDLSFDAVPRPPSTWIEVDPQGVRDLVTLFAGKDALDQIPVVAHGGLFNKTFDPFFGWISRRMGGFDLKYLGLSLYGNNGTILMETHDLPEIYRVMKKHYVFWGHRLKMPLRGERYPVVMDEHGVAHTFQTLLENVKAIAAAKRAKNGTRNDEEPKNDPKNIEDENDPACLPPLL